MIVEQLRFGVTLVVAGGLVLVGETESTVKLCVADDRRVLAMLGEDSGVNTDAK